MRTAWGNRADEATDTRIPRRPCIGGFAVGFRSSLLAWTAKAALFSGSVASAATERAKRSPARARLLAALAFFAEFLAFLAALRAFVSALRASRAIGAGVKIESL